MIGEAAHPRPEFSSTPVPTPFRSLEPLADWRIVGATSLLSFTFGVACALIVKAFGDWHVGLPAERAVMLWLHDWELPELVSSALLLIPWLGTNPILLPVTALAALHLWRRGRLDLAAHLLVVNLLTLFDNWALKHLFDRDRPELFERVGWFGWASYPSGHAMASISVLGSYALLLRRERGWRWPTYLAAAITLANAYGRMYHGVHWPTDVAAGIGVGLILLVGAAIGFGPQARARVAATRAELSTTRVA